MEEKGRGWSDGRGGKEREKEEDGRERGRVGRKKWGDDSERKKGEKEERYIEKGIRETERE